MEPHRKRRPATMHGTRRPESFCMQEAHLCCERPLASRTLQNTSDVFIARLRAGSASVHVRHTHHSQQRSTASPQPSATAQASAATGASAWLPLRRSPRSLTADWFRDAQLDAGLSSTPYSRLPLMRHRAATWCQRECDKLLVCRFDAVNSWQLIGFASCNTAQAAPRCHLCKVEGRAATPRRSRAPNAKSTARSERTVVATHKVPRGSSRKQIHKGHSIEGCTPLGRQGVNSSGYSAFAGSERRRHR